MIAPGLAGLASKLAAPSAGAAGPLADAWLEAAVRASVQGGLAAVAVWLLCRLLPRLPPALAAALWWAVCLKIVVALVWGWPVAGAVAAGPVDREVAEETSSEMGGAVAARGVDAFHVEGLSTGGAGDRDVTVDRSALRASPAADGGHGSVEAERVEATRAAFRTHPVATARSADSLRGASPAAPSERRSRLTASPLAGLARFESALVASVPPAARTTLMAAWLLGLAIVLAGSLGRHRRLRDALAAAEPVTDPVPSALVARLAGRVGVRPPRLLASERVASPLVAGPFRPRIVVPRRALAGTPEELEMLLFHELVHLRRRDLALGLVPALAGRLFWFHPLAALAAREHLVAREAACDAEVVRRLDAAPRAYGRLLLRWGVVGPSARAAAAVAAHDRNHLKRRLLMLAQTPSPKVNPSRRSRAWLAAAAIPAAALLLPLRWVAETDAAPHSPPPRSSEATPADRPTTAPAAPAGATPTPRTAPAVPAVSSLPAVPAAPAPAVPSARAIPAVASAPAAPAARSGHAVPAPAPVPLAVAHAAAGPEAPAFAFAAESGSSSSVHIGWGDGGDGYAVLDGDGYSTFGGGYWSADRARELRRSPGEPLLLFRRDGDTYVVRDPDLVSRALDATRPMRELGERQGRLGGEQGELGGRQGALGGEQGKLGASQGELGAEMGRLGGRLGSLVAEKVRLEAERARPGATRDAATLERIAELDREIEGIESQMHALGERMRALGDEQRELGDRQRALGESQRELGERQRALGMQQRELAGKAREQLESLADRALEAGKAERVDL